MNPQLDEALRRRGITRAQIAARLGVAENELEAMLASPILQQRLASLLGGDALAQLRGTIELPSLKGAR